MTLTQKIIVSLVLPIVEILTIEYHKLYNTFLQVTFRSQSQLKPTRRPERGRGFMFMGANKKSSTELDLCPEFDPTCLSSNSIKTT
jgi:hypothetical protein